MGSEAGPTFRNLILDAGATGVELVASANPSAARTVLSTLSAAEISDFIAASVAALVDASPGTLDTLNELAAALGDDPNFASTVTNALAGKVDSSSLSESIDDRVSALLNAGTNITLTYNDASNTLTIAGNAGGVSSLGTSGNDLNISGSTLNVPDASATARGVITTGSQTISGSKYINGTTRVYNPSDLTRYLEIAHTSSVSTIKAQSSLQITTVGGGGVTVYQCSIDGSVAFVSGPSGFYVSHGDALTARGIFGGAGLSSASGAITLSNGYDGASRRDGNTFTFRTGHGASSSSATAGQGGCVIFDLGKGGDGTGFSSGANGKVLIRSTTEGSNTGVGGVVLDVAGSSAFTSATFSGLVSLGAYTVGTLPSASANAGAAARVTDSSVSASGNYGAVVAGGGSGKVKVFSDGTNWIIA